MNNETLRSAEDWIKQQAKLCARRTTGLYFKNSDDRVLEAAKVIEKYLINATQAALTEAAEVDLKHHSSSIRKYKSSYEAILALRDKKSV